MIGPSRYAAAGYSALKLETHLHTLHSDGRDSVQAMFDACAAAGYDAVAITDHNTVSGLPEARLAARARDLVLVDGVEVTTFRGHSVVLGVSRTPEWRDLETRGMDDLAEQVHAEGGLMCISHPVRLGSPWCSGCAWEWPIRPAAPDLWEVFSAPHPGFPHADASLRVWRDCLAGGGRAAPVGAGDVHTTETANQQRPATYVWVSERSGRGVLDALRHGRTSAGSQPLEFWLERDGQLALAGEQVRGDGWRPHAGDGASVQGVKVPGGRCLYAERRRQDGSLLAISAPIWIATSTADDTRV